jgi:hypothetical protein
VLEGIKMLDSKLLERVHDIYLETGIYLPVVGTPEGNRAYKLWAEWILYRLEGDGPEAETKALAAIEAWEGSILSVLDPWRKFRLLS